MKYKTILMDPPWNCRGGGKIKRGADKHYPLLKTPDIIKVIYQSGVWYPDPGGTHVYMWCTNNFIEDGLFVFKALGVRYITNLVWAKASYGIGQYFRGQHELCLFGVIGKPKKTLEGKVTPSLIQGTKTKRIHSRKPSEMYEVIERNSPEPRLEIFATQFRLGWTSWGKPGTERSGILTVNGWVCS